MYICLGEILMIKKNLSTIRILATVFLLTILQKNAIKR